jgi:hypothetical protein
MDSTTDPALITVKVTLPGPDGDSNVRKFKWTMDSLRKDTIHKAVIIPLSSIHVSLLISRWLTRLASMGPLNVIHVVWTVGYPSIPKQASAQ